MTFAELRYDTDWRISPLYDVIVGIDAALTHIGRRIDNEDGIAAREHAEPLFGLGFVTAQTYAAGTCSDLNRVRRHLGKPEVDKHTCLRCDPFMIRGQVTRLELINAMANYFKHHDEWLQWSDRRARSTTDVLAKVGIPARSESPCIEAVELFSGSAWEFVVIHTVVKEWREHLFQVLR